VARTPRWRPDENWPKAWSQSALPWRALPADAPAGAEGRPRFDLIGLLQVAPGMVGVLLGLSNVSNDGGFGHSDVLLPLIIGLVRLLRVRSVGASSAALFLTGACMYGAMFLLPLYYQELRGFDVLGAALVLIPQGVGSLLTRTVTGRLTDRIGGRAVAVAGFVLVALATVPLALAGRGTSEWWLGAVLLVRGLGLGVVLIPVMTVAFVDIDPDDMPDASGGRPGSPCSPCWSPTRPRPARPPDNRQPAAGGYGLRSSGWHRHLPGPSRR
jgi:Major Facilitator Superfamily